MARKRMVDPSMFTSESVASLPVPTRYTWVGLLCYLDDQGRGKDNPALIKATVWPLDESYSTKKVAADVDRLVGAGMLCRYECGGSRWFHAPTWTTWQKISHPTHGKSCPCGVHDPDLSKVHQDFSGHAPEDVRSHSAGFPPNVVEVSSVERSSSGSTGLCAHGRSAPRFCSTCRSDELAGSTSEVRQGRPA